ncbi:hypothetical protein L596_008097 [Steinernema carpocapsae]|uniref:STAS domain-containing protein n=1 Tax=Steinernema carpocapsae TaxID=34508 RepID=A0A4U5PBE8_STECR|nr:hypothetical protein L596_008097 [Steinernema carpocapsae]
MAVLSSIFSFHTAFGVAVVGEIPSGLPYPTLPELGLLGDCFSDGIGLAVVAIAIHLSIAKVFSKKMKTGKLDYSQELYALGFTNILSSVFSCLPTSTGIGRSVVAVESGIKSFLSNTFSALVILLVILWLGPFFEQLPLCVLATVVIVSLRSVLLKARHVPRLFRNSKIDFAIWIFAFSSTIITDVMTGFAASFAFAIFTVVLRNQWPSWTAKTSKDNRICVFSFQSAIIFSNCANFKKNFSKTFDLWDIKSTFLDYYFVFDFGSVAAVDTMGVGTLKEIANEISERRNVDVYFLGTNEIYTALACVCRMRLELCRGLKSSNSQKNTHSRMRDGCPPEGGIPQNHPERILRQRLRRTRNGDGKKVEVKGTARRSEEARDLDHLMFVANVHLR